LKPNVGSKSREELIAIIDQLYEESEIQKQKLIKEKESLQFELAKLKAQLFGSKADKVKWTPEELRQGLLFNEIENYLGDTEEAEQERHPSLYSKVKTHTRIKPGRTKIPDHFPRVEILCDLPESEKTCACGHTMHRFGEEILEKVDIIPAVIQVNRYIRPKYACKHCKGNHPEVALEVKTAPPVPQFLPKAIAETGMIAYSLISKFCDGLPFYRLSNILSRYGFEISRSTLCNYSLWSYERLKYLEDQYWEEILKSPYLQIDETPVKVLKVPEKSSKSKCYMFVIRALVRGRPILLYQFNTTRSARFLFTKLQNYQGVVQTDGWKSYDVLFASLSQVIHAGCWTHVRRGFAEILKIFPNHSGSGFFLSKISELYGIESKSENLSLDEKKKIRNRESRIVVEEIRKFLDSELLTILGDTPYGKSLNYLKGQWEKLLLFLDHPELPLDTNFVENAIRPFVVGRKNWLFSGNQAGAEASAFFYSLIETAKANGREPFSSLKSLMEEIRYDRFPSLQKWVH